MLKLLIFAVLVTGAAYMFILRNRKMKFEVEFEMEPAREDAKEA